MGWMQALYNTYEKSLSLVGVPDEFGKVLLPIAHSTQNAQVEITINMEGDFVSARKVEKGEEITIIPVTEDSGSRANGIAPHPLCDKLCYVAGDYIKYCNQKSEDCFKAYLEQLGNWVHTGCSPLIKAVYLYVSKKFLVHDLIKAQVLTVTSDGRLDSSVNIEKISQPDVFVRFRVQPDPKLGLGVGEIWKDKNIYDDYISYYLTRIEKRGLDYITGETILCSDKQPSKIRHSADKAKLISANDSVGFTYRGRFANKTEALSLGYIPSQKAHNALKWLIDRQGYIKEGRAIVVWNPENKNVPVWYNDTYSFLSGGDKEVDIMPDLAKEYALLVKQAIVGNFSNLDTANSEIVVMAVDAATPGRLSVTYFRQIMGSAFLKRLIEWHTSCIWAMGYKRDKKGKAIVMAPSIYDIINASYGSEQNKGLVTDGKIFKETMERLLPCVIDGKSIPEDIIKAVLYNALSPLSFSQGNRRKIIDIACALLNRKYKINQKEDGLMSLKREKNDISYLYGRLHAVMHKIEYDTYSEEERGKRETNATRYTSQLIQNPGRTIMLLRGKIEPYLKKLNVGIRTKYIKEMQQISDLCDEEAFSSVARLREQYLLGYNCELSYLFNSQKSEEKKDVVNNEEGIEEREGN